MHTSKLQKLLFWILSFCIFLFFSLSFQLLFFSFIFIPHLLHSRIISICCSLWERERERCQIPAQDLQWFHKRLSAALRANWLTSGWEWCGGKREKEDWRKKLREEQSSQEGKKKIKGRKKAWGKDDWKRQPKRQMQRARAMQKCVQANWEGEPWQYLPSWPCFLLLLQLKRIEELAAMRWTGMRGNHMHANFHSFLVIQLFTEWFAIHTHM